MCHVQTIEFPWTIYHALLREKYMKDLKTFIEMQIVITEIFCTPLNAYNILKHFYQPLISHSFLSKDL